MKKVITLLTVFLCLLFFLTGCKESESKGKLYTHIDSAHVDSAHDESIHGAGTYYTCAMHPNYLSDKPGKCPFCGMTLVPVKKNVDSPTSTTIKIDPTVIQNMGVKTEVVESREISSELRASGIVKVDESRIYIITARVMGYIKNLKASVTGQKILQHQLLFEIDSPDLRATQEELLQAIKFSEKQKTGGNANDSSASVFATSARKRLLNWGIDKQEIEAIEKMNVINNNLSIKADHDGVILDKMIVEGQSIMPGMELLKMADLSRVWVSANVYQADLARVKMGTKAEVELDYLAGKKIQGKVKFISPVLDEQTKTVEVRVEVKNTPDLDLKPQMFATLHFKNMTNKNGVAVQEQSIIHSGKRNIVIVALGQGYFEPREVVIGATFDGYIEIIAGLKVGENIVVASQFLIDSESNLKAAIQKLQSSQK